MPDTPVIVAPVEEDEFPLNTEDHFGYIVGYEDGTVRPQGNITRAEVATIFYRLLTDEPPGPGGTPLRNLWNWTAALP